MNQEKKLSPESFKFLDISWGTIFKILAAIVFAYFVYLIKDLIVWFIFALVISILFEPIINFLIKRRIPRTFAVLSAYLFFFGILTFSVYSSLPFLISEIRNFSAGFPQQIPIFFEKVSPMFKQLGINTFESFDAFLADFQKPLEEITKNIFNILIVFFGGIMAAFFTIGMALFISLEKGLMEKFLILFFPKKYENNLIELWNKSKEKVIGWFLMRIIGVIFVGLSSFIIFKILNVNYPVSLAVIAGTFDFVPIVGPLLAAILIFITVALDSFAKAIFVIVAFALVEIAENAILFPLLSRRMIRVSPLIVLAGLFIGAKIWGFLGAIILVPLMAIMFEFLKDFIRQNKEEMIFSSSSRTEE